MQITDANVSSYPVKNIAMTRTGTAYISTPTHFRQIIYTSKSKENFLLYKITNIEHTFKKA